MGSSQFSYGEQDKTGMKQVAETVHVRTINFFPVGKSSLGCFGRYWLFANYPNTILASSITFLI